MASLLELRSSGLSVDTDTNDEDMEMQREIRAMLAELPDDLLADTAVDAGMGDEASFLFAGEPVLASQQMQILCDTQRHRIAELEEDAVHERAVYQERLVALESAHERSQHGLRDARTQLEATNARLTTTEAALRHAQCQVRELTHQRAIQFKEDEATKTCIETLRAQIRNYEAAMQSRTVEHLDNELAALSLRHDHGTRELQLEMAQLQRDTAAQQAHDADIIQSLRKEVERLHAELAQNTRECTAVVENLAADRQAAQQRCQELLGAHQGDTLQQLSRQLEQTQQQLHVERLMGSSLKQELEQVREQCNLYASSLRLLQPTAQTAEDENNTLSLLRIELGKAVVSNKENRELISQLSSEVRRLQSLSFVDPLPGHAPPSPLSPSSATDPDQLHTTIEAGDVCVKTASKMVQTENDDAGQAELIALRRAQAEALHLRDLAVTQMRQTLQEKHQREMEKGRVALQATENELRDLKDRYVHLCEARRAWQTTECATVAKAQQETAELREQLQQATASHAVELAAALAKARQADETTTQTLREQATQAIGLQQETVERLRQALLANKQLLQQCQDLQQQGKESAARQLTLQAELATRRADSEVAVSALQQQVHQQIQLQQPMLAREEELTAQLRRQQEEHECAMAQLRTRQQEEYELAIAQLKERQHQENEHAMAQLRETQRLAEKEEEVKQAEHARERQELEAKVGQLQHQLQDMGITEQELRAQLATAAAMRDRCDSDKNELQQATRALAASQRQVHELKSLIASQESQLAANILGLQTKLKEAQQRATEVQGRLVIAEGERVALQGSFERQMEVARQGWQTAVKEERHVAQQQWRQAQDQARQLQRRCEVLAQQGQEAQQQHAHLVEKLQDHLDTAVMQERKRNHEDKMRSLQALRHHYMQTASRIKRDLRSYLDESRQAMAQVFQDSLLQERSTTASHLHHYYLDTIQRLMPDAEKTSPMGNLASTPVRPFRHTLPPTPSPSPPTSGTSLASDVVSSRQQLPSSHHTPLFSGHTLQ